MTKKTLFKLTGMHCSSCAMNIDGELEDTPGVKSSSTSFARQQVEVEFDPAVLSSQDIIDIIKKTGYDAQVKE